MDAVQFFFSSKLYELWDKFAIESFAKLQAMEKKTK